MGFTSLEICAGAGGQALGLEGAGFDHAQLVEIEPPAASTLRLNRPEWSVVEGDVKAYSGRHLKGIELVAGGVPCPPFSKAGKQLGSDDERDLFPEALRLVEEIRPQAVMLENVRGLLDPVFNEYRESILCTLRKLGYEGEFRLIHASDFGVPQLRPRAIFVGMKKSIYRHFVWPEPRPNEAKSVGETLYDLMKSGGWAGADAWRDVASSIAPTLVGGSKKHGGPDLGPTRAKKAWAVLGVNGKGIADAPPGPEFEGMPKLTVRMAARLQGFPDEWEFSGRKTAAYRQVGNAFPPPVAQAVGKQLVAAMNEAARKRTAVRSK